MTKYNVIVCAALLNSENKIFIARRKPEKKLGGFWEFPGGKLEDGEELEAALKREFVEELDIKITIDKLLHVKPYVYDHGAVLILFYLGKIESGEITLTDHDEYKWCTVPELRELKLLPANEEVLVILEALTSNLENV